MLDVIIAPCTISDLKFKFIEKCQNNSSCLYIFESLESSLEDETDPIGEPWNFAKLTPSGLLKRLSEVFGKPILKFF